MVYEDTLHFILVTAYDIRVYLRAFDTLVHGPMDRTPVPQRHRTCKDKDESRCTRLDKVLFGLNEVMQRELDMMTRPALCTRFERLWVMTVQTVRTSLRCWCHSMPVYAHTYLLHSHWVTWYVKHQPREPIWTWPYYDCIHAMELLKDLEGQCARWKRVYCSG